MKGGTVLNSERTSAAAPADTRQRVEEREDL